MQPTDIEDTAFDTVGISVSTSFDAGHDPVTVAARLGHSPETLLRVYAQEIEHGQVEVAASLAARLDG